MSKRSAEIQLNQNNYQCIDANQEDEGGSSAFKYASKDIIEKRDIKKPKSRIGISSNSKFSKPEENSQKAKLFGGFSFINPNSSDNNPQSNTTTATSFSFQPKPSEPLFSVADTEKSTSIYNNSTANMFQSNKKSSNELKHTNSNSESNKLNNNSLFSNPTSSSGFSLASAKDFSYLQASDSTSKINFTSSINSNSLLFNNTANPFQPQTSLNSEKNTKNSLFSVDNTPRIDANIASSKNSQSNNLSEIKEYLKCMRGLNISFVKSINRSIEADPFVDISSMFNQYKQFLHDLKSKNAQIADIVTKENLNPTESISSNNSIEHKNTTNDLSAGSKPIFSLDSAANNSKNSSSAFSSSNPITSNSGAFNKSNLFGSKQTLETSQQLSSSIFGSTISTKTEPNAETANKDKTDEPSSKLSFNFGKTANKDKTDEASSKSLFNFGNSDSKLQKSVFGNSFSSTQLTTSDSDNKSQTNTKLAPFVIGNNVSTSFLASPLPSEKKSNDASKLFTFDGSKPSGFSIFNSNNTASISSFGFGKDEKPKSTSDIVSKDNDEAANSTENQDDDAVEPSSPSKLPSKNGEGEEDEETVYEIRSKIFRYNTEVKEYIDLGVSYLKVKTCETGDKKTARLLSRQEGTNNVTLNVAIFKKMPVNHAENSKTVGIVTIGEDLKPTSYMIRVKTIDLAVELSTQIKKEQTLDAPVKAVLDTENPKAEDKSDNKKNKANKNKQSNSNNDVQEKESSNKSKGKNDTKGSAISSQNAKKTSQGASSAECKEFLTKHGISVSLIKTGEEASGLYPPVLSFADSGFSDVVLKCCAEYSAPTPIQSACWPALIAERDVVGVAETGSGKTMAFALPAVNKLLALKSLESNNNSKNACPLVLVLAPTRELALQTQEQFDKIQMHVKSMTSICLYGGVPKYDQKKNLFSAKPKIVVATPGRLLDLVQEGALDLSHIKFLCLDEADRMLDRGFEQDIRRIIEHTRNSENNESKQTVMFSATWPEEIRTLASEFLVDPIRVNVGGIHGKFDEDGNPSQNTDGKLIVNHRVKQIIEVIDPYAKEQKILSLLQKYHEGQKSKLLLFVLYKKEATRIENFLHRNGYNCCSIHGDKSQDLRTQAYNSFKSGSIPLLIATDVAARGLDIPNVDYVINYTFPLTIEDYIHRIGRTGRAGKSGISHTFFTLHDKHHSGSLINVLKEAKMEVPGNLMKFGTTVKKKEHKTYGAFYKDIDPSIKPTKIVFD
ncbi:hypothetical protein BB561_000493 [Smittium simulii]|uniref:RNA helicase n=1 Tax=Smittium simulii TaxID=133385 RepID=A0A2T9YYW1_9FUNG|nr:hypothetical protein BB561_000493 [Smittium simulii]